MTDKPEPPALPYAGGCLCGAIRYEVSAAPKNALFCHCTDCKKYTGAPFSAFLVVTTEALKVLKGQPREYRITSHSGNETTRDFCGECGSHLFGGISPYPQIRTIEIGSLDDPAWASPKAHVWGKRELDWATIADGLTRHPENA